MPFINRVISALIALFAALAAASASIASQPSGREPPVPPSTARGGVMIAILGNGADYRHPLLASSLARDGEGDLIAWDFVDGDNRPFAQGGLGTTDAVLLAMHAPAAGLVVVKQRPGDPEAIGHMVAFATRTPARIIVWPDADPSRPDWPILDKALRHFSDHLFIVPGRAGVIPRPNNLLVVADQSVAAPPHWPAGTGPDIAVSWFVPPGQSRAREAALLVAALAARLSRTNPGLKAAELKARIMSLKTRAADVTMVVGEADVTQTPAGK